ncbi:flagellar hook-basal body complex protein [Methylobacterium sp. WL120]|uniref:flagellar hook protein FlgE n=1 Tax=Methylobacterium sp. WL120 TaxID=2603887 RepID=UPI0011CAED79|nr:flagellar hook-basal body complex protein [Methylobacterium sp. WL120]TXM64661.1 flagellar hook-basal body complex protein [Methylobacterium sp. WL120]
MDIFSALQTAVSGLKAQSYAINNISGNIANSQTTGYKRVDTSFVDLMAEQTPKHEVAGTVLAQAQLTNTIQGNIASTQVATNMAISGQGFFTVQQKTGDANGQATFSGQTMYTRRGDFTPDKDGYLVNGAGGYLLGQNIDPITGQTTSQGPIKVANVMLPAKPTDTITYAANLPSAPVTSTSATAGSYLYKPTNTTLNVTSTTAPTDAGPSTASAKDVTELTNNSIIGPQVTAYTTTGAPVTVSTRWAKVSDADSANKKDAVWNLFYQSDSTATSPVWTNAGMAVTFDGSGQMTEPSAGLIPINKLTVNGTNLGTVNINVAKSSLTQYANATGAASTNALTQNGNSAGTLNSVAVGDDGKLNGTFSNGTVATLANVGIAHFTNPDGLKPNSAGNYLQTAESGVPLSGLNGGTLTGSSVEQSNTDIASEFSKIIVTQQAYSANTRVMSTAQTMMSDLMNIIR